MSELLNVDLPPFGEAAYFPDFLAEADAWALFHELRDGYDLAPRTIKLADGTEWCEEIGKLMFVEPGLVDPEVFPEAHGRRVPWPASIERLVRRVAAMSGVEYQVCVAICYPDGGAAMGYHHDPAAFGDTDSIASVSLGAERLFAIRSREKPSRTWRLRLGHGSLFLMGAGFQDAFEHALLPEPGCGSPRINLTFRRFGRTAGGRAERPTSVNSAEPKIRLQPALDGDEAFLFEVFAAVRAAGLRSAGLEEGALRELLALQFRAQQAQYRATYPDAEWALVLLDGVRVGYRCVARRDDAIVLVDVAFLPGHTGQGLGGRLLRGLLDEADAAGLPVLAHVDKTNPARRFYARLGFETLADDGVRLEIRRPPSGGA